MPKQLRDRERIKRRRYRMTIDENDQETGVFAISLVEAPAIEENWVYLSKQHKIMLSEANGEKRLLIGPVLIPNKEIPRVDQETGEQYDIIFDEGVIEKAAQLFLQRQYNNESTLEHGRPINDISIVESWLVADSKADKSNTYGLSYPKGTWMVMAKVNNDSIWNDYVKTGKVKGFSLEGLFGHNLVEASKQQLSAIEDWDIEYAEELLESIKGIIKKDGRVKGGKFVELETYNDYPDAVKNNAKRGIELNEKVNNKCATPVGKIRAQQLANGRNISVQTIKRMYAYTSRAREFYNPDDKEACGTISYLLWGGDAANRWSAAKLKELGLFEGETAVGISSSYAGQFGGPGVMKSKKPKYSNYVDTTDMSAQFITGPTSEKDKKRFPGNKGTMFYPYIAPALLEDQSHITLIACSATKLESTCMAKDMYQGSLFKKSLEYALKTTNPKNIYILSAKYGLVELEQEIEPYDKTLKDMDIDETQSWVDMIMDKLYDLYEDLNELHISILAGKAYYEPLIESLPNYDLPLEGLRIGEQMKELDELVAAELSQLSEEDRMEVILDVMLLQLAKVGPKGGIKESPKAPKSDTPNPNPKGQGTAGGSAAGARGADVSKQDEETLQKKVDEFNTKESNTKNGRATLGQLKSVFQRGLGAYNTSRSPRVTSAKQWALARVNAYLYLLKNGRPQNEKYVTDFDLLPKDHPKSTR
jgi:hypothetical protein